MSHEIKRVIFHIDMDAFFASVEQRDNPEYRGKPVIVGAKPGNRGVVSTASYEARKFGIHSAMPISEAYSRCQQGIFITPRMSVYEDVSRQIMDIFSRFTPRMERISVDEAFLDMSGTEKLFGPPAAAARMISTCIHDELQLTGSIGVAPNKFLAKLASDCHKPNGITIVPFNHEEIVAWMAPMSVKRIWGVGRKSAVVLETMGIYTIGDLQNLPLDTLIHHFGKGGHSLFYLCKGIDDRPVGDTDSVKSISREVTFNRDSSDREEWMQVLYELAQDVASRARRQDVKGSTVVLTWRKTDFSRCSRRVTLSQPTNVSKVIFEKVNALLASVHERALRLIGVGLTNLACEVQTDLFSQSDGGERLETSEITADSIRGRFGTDALVKGRELQPGSKRKRIHLD
jgi:DNA polymerase-4